jgi:hypothetical protein
VCVCACVCVLKSVLCLSYLLMFLFSEKKTKDRKQFFLTTEAANVFGGIYNLSFFL